MEEKHNQFILRSSAPNTSRIKIMSTDTLLTKVVVQTSLTALIKGFKMATDAISQKLNNENFNDPPASSLRFM